LARVQGVHCSFFDHPPPSLDRRPSRDHTGAETDWAFVTLGGFNGSDTTDMLFVEVYDINNNQLTGAAGRSKERKNVKDAQNRAKGRRFVCGDQSGRTSAPINPHAVQTIRGHKGRTSHFIRQRIGIHDCAVVAPARTAKMRRSQQPCLRVTEPTGSKISQWRGSLWEQTQGLWPRSDVNRYPEIALRGFIDSRLF
jgi:hypothetical protein